MDRQYTAKEFITLFNTHHTDQQVREMFQSEFGELKGSTASSMGIATCGKGSGCERCSFKIVK
jgi:hypothetical protein